MVCVSECDGFKGVEGIEYMCWYRLNWEFVVYGVDEGCVMVVGSWNGLCDCWVIVYKLIG